MNRIGILVLVLAACMGGCLEPTPDDPDVTKTDVDTAVRSGTTDDLCDDLGAPPGCDLCDELGYYGDDECDLFCPMPDEDCGAVALYSAPMECEDDSDCPEDMRCEGAITCPEGAFCILPPTPGECVPVIECEDDSDCPDDMLCEGAIDCPEGAFRILPPTPGTCEPDADDCPDGTSC